MSSSRIHQLIDLWQWKAIFWTCIIQVWIVYASHPLSVAFLTRTGFDTHSGYRSWRMKPFSQLVHFSRCNESLRTQVASLLLHRYTFGIHIQCVPCNFWRYSTHVRVRPSEHIQIAPKKACQFLRHPHVELRFNLQNSCRIIQNDLYVDRQLDGIRPRFL